MSLKRKTPTKRQGLEAARRLKEILQQKGIPVHSVFLFGSLAKGTMHEWSDIDLAVIHEPFGQNRTEEMRTMCRAEHGSDLRNIEVVYFHPEDMENKYSTIVQEVKKYGIPV